MGRRLDFSWFTHDRWLMATSVAENRVGRSDEEDAARPCRLDPQFIP